MAFGYVSPYRRPVMTRSSSWTGSSLIQDLNRQINGLFDELFDDDDEREAREFGSRNFRNMPAIEVSQTDDRYEISAELPGVKEENIDLTIEDNVLTLSGEKKRISTSDDSKWSERSYGSFERWITLPKNIDKDKIEADFEDGVLMISLPKSEEKSRGRKIELKRREANGATSNERRLIDDDSTKIEENA